MNCMHGFRRGRFGQRGNYPDYFSSRAQQLVGLKSLGVNKAQCCMVVLILLMMVKTSKC